MLDWLGLITLLALGYAIFIGGCALLIARRLRRPPRRTYAWALRKGIPGDPGELTPPLEFTEREITWTAPGSRRAVTIPIWDVRGGLASGGASGAISGGGPVVVLTPGWGDSRVGGLARLSAIAPHCSRILLWDPPGLGASEFSSRDRAHAQPSRDRQGADSPPATSASSRGSCAPRWSMSVHDHLALLVVLDEMIAPGDASPIVLFGWSAGAGASILAAEASCARAAERNEPRAQAMGSSRAHRPNIAGVIAEAPYRLPWTPARNVLRSADMPWFLCGPLAFASLGLRLRVGPIWRGFDRAAHAAKLLNRTLTLILHGDADEVCPIDDGRAIAHAAGAQLVEIPGGRHNDLWVDDRFRDRSARAVREFMLQCGGGIPHTPSSVTSADRAED